MFDTPNTCVGGFFYLYGDGDVTGNGQAHLRCLGGSGEENLSRSMVVNLDEVNPKALQLTHSESRLFGVGDVKAIRKVWRCVIHHWAGGHDLRAEHRARPDAVAQRQNEIRIAAHVAGADNALGNEQIQRFRAGSLMVGVHVPKPGNQELSFSIYTAGSRRKCNSGAHRRNAITFGEYRDAGSARTCLDVDYRDTSERHRRNSATNCSPRGRPGLSVRWQWAVDQRNSTQPDRNPTGKEVAHSTSI